MGPKSLETNQIIEKANLEEPRIGDWVQMYGGGQFFPLDPRASEINIKDIAHALGKMCRFNCQCLQFYSVADHSVRCLRYLYEHKEMCLGLYYRDIVDTHKWLLMHDVAESLGLGDLPRPIKRMLPEFVKMEEKILSVVAQKFNLPYPVPEQIEKIVKKIDNIFLMTEKRDIMAGCEHKWGMEDSVIPDNKTIIPYTSQEATRSFLEEYYNLFENKTLLYI